jgi:hypothetical protein
LKERQIRLEERLGAIIENAGGTYRSTWFDTLVTARTG